MYLCIDNLDFLKFEQDFSVSSLGHVCVIVFLFISYQLDEI